MKDDPHPCGNHLTDRPCEYVDTGAKLAAALATWGAQPAIALDTESNSFFAWRERTCLVQVSTREADWIVDPLAVAPAPMAALLADARVEKIIHACEGDAAALKRDFGFELHGVFDTLVAARALGRRQVGLGSLVKELLSVDLAKDEQRSDWGRRPLAPSQLAYAYSDTRHLLPLADLLRAEVAARGAELAEEVAVDSDRPCRKPVRLREVDPEAFERHPSARKMEPLSRQVLRALYLAREERGRALDRAVFRIAPDALLGEIAVRRPQTRAEISRVSGMSPAILGRHGEAFLKAVLDALALGPLPRVRHERGPARDPAVEERFEALRRWRRSVAEARGVEVDVIAGNGVLAAVAQAEARTPAELQAAGMDPWRVRRYGEAVLRALRGA